MEDKFWKKVKRGAPNECWPWIGYKRPSGHGLTSYNSTPCNASRKAWILANGPIQGDLCVNHRCDNAECCNPAHMYLGTRADNLYDRFGKIPAELRGMGARRCALSDEDLAIMWEMRRGGATMRECGDRLGVHHTTIARYITAVRREKAKLLARVRLSGSRLSRA